jgi:hypothetical protein
MVVPFLRHLVARLLWRRHVFDPGSVYVGFVVDKVALGQGFPEYFGLPQSISFHQCSITRKVIIIIVIIIIIIIIIIISFIMRLHKKP